MPIYAYKCSSCGHTQDALQKVTDDPLTVCAACGQSTLSKQLTAPGFQLKGSGWYATDFKGGGTAATKEAKAEAAPATDTKPAATCETGGCASCSTP
jgi:putative FmdB family regulatory protein